MPYYDASINKNGSHNAVVSAFPPAPKASAWPAEARFAREGGRRTVARSG